MKNYFEVNEDQNGKRIDIYNENWYYINRKYIPSVTYILSSYIDKGLAEWFKMVGMNASSIFNRAGEVGTAFHNLVEKFLKYGSVHYTDIENPEYTIEVWERFARFYEYWEKYLKPFKDYKVEKTIVNEKYGYAGTVDLILNIDGEIVIYDWKTSKAVHEGHKAQISAYAKALDCKHANIVIFDYPTRTKQGYSIMKLDNEKIDYYFEKFLWVKKGFSKKEPRLKSLPISYKKD